MSDLNNPRPRSPSRLYQPSTSILLLGFEGSGRRTLGIIASLSLKRQYIDFGRYFAQATGQTLSQFVLTHDIASFKSEVPNVLKNLLEIHSQNCVIGGLPQSCVRYQRDLLLSFAGTNPVIYVRRANHKLEVSSIQDPTKMVRLHQALEKFYASCSNFDYFNLDDENATERNTLRLKHVETNFIHFIRRVLGYLPSQSFSKDPFSLSYTYALQVHEEQLDAGFNFRDLECGADAINFNVNPFTCINSYEQLAQRISMLRHHSSLPIILDIQTDSTDHSVYALALRSALRLVPDAITIDLNTDQEVVMLINSIKGFVKVIGTYHHDRKWMEFQNSPSFFRIQAIAAKVSLHSLRISAEAQSNSDNLDCFEFAYSMKRSYKMPLTTFNTGSEGRTSICLNQTLSPVVLSENEMGITIQQARKALCLSFILDTKKFSIFGSSISYSLSPAMHNAAYEVCGLPHSYGIKQSDDFRDIQDLLSDEDYGGVAVTMPFKAQALTLLDIVEPEAAKIGAVNTIVIERYQKSRILKGYNTDHIGVRECLLDNLSPANSIRSGSTALIFGAGGMARATIYALQHLSVRNICICNRTCQHAQMLVEEYSTDASTVRVLDIDDPWPAEIEQPTMIFSTIPAHRVGNFPAHELSIPEAWLRSASGGTFVELAYKPLVTRFIAQMSQVHGWIVVDGLQVLLAQGIAQFELFTEASAPVRAMQDALRQQYHSVTRAASPA